ncbi:MAG: sulfite oxidase-like oxidoreductase [Pseudomonadota bacterium]
MVAKKVRWAVEGRPRRRADADAQGPTTRDDQRRRLPPGQQLVTDWPVLDLGHQPAVDLRDFRLAIGGMVEQSVAWDWDAFAALGHVDSVSDIHCVTAWSRFDNRWRGLPTTALLDAVRPKPEARFVMVKSHDGYATNLPIEALRVPDGIVATHWNDEPLSRAHGGPARLVLPQLYFWKSAKWVRQFWFMDRDAPGFWEARGYHPLGDPWREQRTGPPSG